MEATRFRVIGKAPCRRALEIKEMWCLRKKPFKVSVDLMAEPCLWRWEIRDPKTDEVMASSWADDWEAYETSEHALRAVAARLSSMAHAPRRRALAA